MNITNNPIPYKLEDNFIKGNGWRLCLKGVDGWRRRKWSCDIEWKKAQLAGAQHPGSCWWAIKRLQGVTNWNLMSDGLGGAAELVLCWEGCKIARVDWKLHNECWRSCCIVAANWLQVETVDDYDEYCHYVAGLVGLGLSKLFHASRLENVAPDSLSKSMGLFLQKTNIIRDYLEDINEIPKSRMFWPRQIWNKYANKLEDLKYEENSVKAVQCLNDMVTNALVHAEDCLKYLSILKTHSIFRFCAIPQLMAIGTLALCYNNVEVFRGVVKMRRGLTARISDQTRSMADVYGAFYDFSCLLETKVDEKDPNASLTRKRVDAIKKVCASSGLLKKRGLYVEGKREMYASVMIMIIVLLLALYFAARLMK